MDPILGKQEKDILSEVYLLVAKFLSEGPCQETFQVFERELREKGLLPRKFDFTGRSHSQSLDELSKKFPHITSQTLVQICERLRQVQEESSPLGVVGVSSILGRGRYSLIRARNRPLPLPTTRIYARLHGCPLPDSLSPSVRNIVRTLEARRISGPVSRKHLMWPKIYSRLQLLKQTVGHLSAVYCVLFDQTGRFIFTGADDLLVKVWSTHSGRLLVTFRGASSEITDLAVNIENTLLAAGSLDRVLYVWCLQTTSVVARLAAPVGMITGVNFCPTTCGDFRYLACTSTDGSVAFWVYTHQPIGKETVFLGQPVHFNEKMRPGVAQMICSAFSPGGTFLAAGSADHHVRVYLIPGDEGPQRIMEEEAHLDRVDSIQWANRHLRFVSGSKDGCALVWKFQSQKWSNLRLDITAELPGYEAPESEEVQRQKPKVTMVCWDRSDQWIITASHDASLKVWNSETGELVRVIRKHRRDVFVLEPHPLDAGITLSAGHDAWLCIWDVAAGTCLFQHQNIIDAHGYGAFYDAKWSPDGTVIAATDCLGHILLFGFGAANQLLKMVPRQVFFNTDYWPVIRDDQRRLVDETTGELLHLMGAPYMVDVEGVAYPAHIQRLVPGREFDTVVHEIMTEDDYTPSTSGHSWANVGAPANFRTANVDDANRVPNGFISKFMLPLLPPSSLQQIRERTDAIGNEEKLEFEREKNRPPEPPKLHIDNKMKPKKKRTKRPQAYRTRAATEESEFLNPDSLDLSLSSAHSDNSSSASSVESESDSTSATEYSDWIADHGVSLAPPKRSRRRRPPRRLSPSDELPTRRKNRENRVGEKQEEQPVEEQAQSASSQQPEVEIRLEDVPSEFLPPKWLSEVVPRKAPYYPQMGDEVVFFQEGYQFYLDAVREKQVYKPSTRDSFSKLGLSDPIFAKVIGIKYEIRPPRLCCLRLAVLRSNGVMTRDFFNIKYHDMPDVIDFLVLKQTYDIAMKRKWKTGDRFRCMIDDSWWLGSIVTAHFKSNDFPHSPFLSLMTKWDNGEDEPMSPWDLEPVDHSRIPDVDGGSIDVLPEETLGLLYSPRPDEWPNGDRDETCDRIVAGIEKVMTLAIAEAFAAPVDLNLYPLYAKTVEYPVDLSTIKSRLENRFYRRLIAVQFDVRYLATNAEKFNDSHSQIVKHARIVSDLCLRIIQDQQVDVVAVYHQLADAYQSSSDEETSEKEDQSNSMDWRGDCDRLLRELVAHPDSAPFRQPVDLIDFPDYMQTVETPMDLGTVREELMAGNYSNPREFYEDMRQIFINSKTYNTNKRSRIFSMSVRLSNLFEARLKQLTSEWKASRRRRIRQSAQTRKRRLEKRSNEPSTSKQFVINPKPNNSTSLQSTEPQPSTSGQNTPVIKLEPLRITILRRRTSESRFHAAMGNSSSSDDDTDLSTLRHNYLKKSGSEDDQLRLGRTELVDEDSNSNFSGKNKREKVITLPIIEENATNNCGMINEGSSSEGDYQVLATLRTNSKLPNEVNGHSYAKPTPTTSTATNSANKYLKNGTDVESNENSQDKSDDDGSGSENTLSADGSDPSNDDELDGRSRPKVTSALLNGRQPTSTGSGDCEDGRGSGTNSDWSNEPDASDGDSLNGADQNERSRSRKPLTRGRLKDRAHASSDSESLSGANQNERPRKPLTRGRLKDGAHVSESESVNSIDQNERSRRPITRGRLKNETHSSESESISGTDADERKPQTRGRLKKTQQSILIKENGRRKQARRQQSSLPRVVTRRRRQASSDSEPDPPRRPKRRRTNWSGSCSSVWRSSDSEEPMATRRSLRVRQAKSESDDSEPLMNVMVSSRGRVRKLTERAKAAFGRRD